MKSVQPARNRQLSANASTLLTKSVNIPKCNGIMLINKLPIIKPAMQSLIQWPMPSVIYFFIDVNLRLILPNEAA